MYRLNVRMLIYLPFLVFLAGCESNSLIRDSGQINSVASPLVLHDVMIMVGVHEKIYTGDNRPVLVAAKPLRKEDRTFIEQWTVESAGKKVEYRVTLEIDFMGTRYSLTRLTETSSVTPEIKSPDDPGNNLNPDSNKNADAKEKTAVAPVNPPTPANDRIVDANQYRPLLEGKTVSGEHVTKGFKFKDYFAPDGSLTEVRDNGKTKQGNWTVSDSGYLCIIWKNRQGCGHLTINDDGSLLFARDGKHVRRFTHFSAGKNL